VIAIISIIGFAEKESREIYTTLFSNALATLGIEDSEINFLEREIHLMYINANQTIIFHEDTLVLGGASPFGRGRPSELTWVQRRGPNFFTIKKNFPQVPIIYGMLGHPYGLYYPDIRLLEHHEATHPARIAQGIVEYLNTRHSAEYNHN